MPTQPERKPRIRMLVEKLADQRFLEGIFRPECESGQIEVDVCGTASGMTSVAQRSLLEGNGQVLALVCNADTEDQKTIDNEVSGPTRRMLTQISPSGWHLAVAVPRLDAWARADGRVAKAFDEAATRAQQSYKELSLLFGDLTDTTPFDRQAAGKAHAEFAALAQFISQAVGTCQDNGIVTGSTASSPKPVAGTPLPAKG